MAYLDRTLASCKNIEIPSLGIVIKGERRVSDLEETIKRVAMEGISTSELMIVNREDVKTLLLAADRAEKAEALIDRMQTALANGHTICMAPSDVDYAVEITTVRAGAPAIDGCGVESILADAIKVALDMLK
jgi:late competence protein required for DNA uptake (superfamily II DNA/RNA helicase)